MSARQKKKTPSVKLSETMENCLTLLRLLTEKPEAEPFLVPVDWQTFGLVDYPQVIKTPMDLGTIENNILNGKLKTANEFANAVRLVWSNAMTYNRPDSDIYATSEKLSKFFEKKFQGKIKSVGTTDNRAVGTVSSSSSSSSQAAASSASRKQKRDEEQREVTRSDRLKFSQLVNQLSSEQLGHVVEIIQKQCPDALNEEDDEEIEIEINNIDPSVLIQLNQYAQTCLSNSGSSVHKAKKQKQ